MNKVIDDDRARFCRKTIAFDEAISETLKQEKVVFFS